MSKKKKQKLTLASIKGDMDARVKSNEKIYEDSSHLHGIIHKNNWDFISRVNVMTQATYDDLWVENLKANVKNKLHRKHKFLADDCIGLGKNKAVVGIGSGPSFNKNCWDLQYFLNRDGVRNWEARNYITICSNHQFKPLLNMGIIPDFVLLVDGSDVVYDQLTTDIPEHGKHSILLTGLHCSPKTLSKWSEQGREIRFMLNSSNPTKEAFEKLAGKNPNKYIMELGGNVLNGAWVISIMKFGSNVFMAVGNDLAYTIYDDLEEQRKNYYSDKDYTTNAKVTGTGRDEAARMKRWAGITEIRERKIFTNNKDRYDVKLDLMGTSHTLWVYKVWLESTIMRQINQPVSFHYFNCTEGGILGVMSRCEDSMNKEEMQKKSNWFLLDEMAVNQHSKAGMYHTVLLKNAMEHFDKCKEVFDRCSGRLDAQSAGGGVARGLEGIAGGVGLQNGMLKNGTDPYR